MKTLITMIYRPPNFVKNTNQIVTLTFEGNLDAGIIADYNDRMNHPRDPETLKIPAFMRNKAIVSQARQKLILTALDRKEAGLSVHSKKATAPVQGKKDYQNALNSLKSTTDIPSHSISTTPKKQQYGNIGISFNSQVSIQEKTPELLKEAGTITHFLEKIEVAIIKLSAPLKLGEKIYLQGEGVLFLQEVTEMQIDRKNVKRAKTGSHIGMKVQQKALVQGKIYKF